MEWKLTEDELPKRKENTNYSQVECLAVKKNSNKVQILVFNHEHECWDDADGDDYNCDINKVKYWAYLPQPPKE